MHRTTWALTFTSMTLGLFASANAQLQFSGPTSYAAGTRPEAAALGDFDGDGDRDIAVTSDLPDRILVYSNNGNGTFSGPQQIFLGNGTSPHALLAMDIENDGDQDLVVSLKNVNQIQIVTNIGGGSFSPGATFATLGSEPRQLAAADFDGNGFADVVASNRESSNVSVFLNSGGSFGPATSLAAGDEPRGVAAADFTGDGAPDFAVASHRTRQVLVFTNNGAGAFSQTGALSVGGQLRPEGVATGDLDGNGTQDIATSTEGNGQSFGTVFLNQGGGSFGGRVDYFITGQDPEGIVARDFDLDGDLDLAMANQTSNNISTLLGSGNGTFGSTQLFGAGARPGDLQSADLDGNGSADLVSVNRDSNDITVLLNGAQGQSLDLVGTPSTGSPIHFTVSGLTGEQGNTAQVLLSCNGTAGFPLPNDGRIVPLTLDGCTAAGLNAAVFLQGTVDATGTASTPDVAFPNAAPGRTVWAAAVTINGPQFVSIVGPISFVTQ
ncbi:MAG: VCBS repeat-containing protein [Planctomycetota bacterium]